MAKITWLGEDEFYEDGYGPGKNAWNGVTFIKGQAVEIDDAHMIAKAKGNHFYNVEEDKAEATKPSKPTLSLPDAAKS
jgi:hypothetical protein